MKVISGSRAAFVAAVFAVSAAPCFAAVKLLSPAEGETVPLLSDGQKAWLDRPRAARVASFADSGERAAMKKLGFVPAKVALSWEWTAPEDGGPVASARPRFTLEVRRLPDGKPVFRADCPEAHAELDNLEIAREYEWTVRADALGRVEPPVSGRFRTEDHAPRLVNLPGVPNVRDLGGRIGLGGRRVRQGLVYRSAGLNSNSSEVFTTREEALASAPDPDALLAREKVFAERADALRAILDRPGGVRLLDSTLSPVWTLFRVSMGDAEFLTNGLPAVLALDSVPAVFLGAGAETAALDADGAFAFSDAERKAAAGPAVFVQEAQFPEDGWISLGCGADWWWVLSANGEIAFDRSFDQGNKINPVAASNHAFLVPVRKGRNLFAVCVRTGSAGWKFCLKAAPAQPLAKLAGNAIANAKDCADALFRISKGRVPGVSRINDANRGTGLGLMGIRSDIDLRSDRECYGMDGSPLGPTVAWWHYSSASYAGMADDWGREAFRNVFRVFLDPANYPIDFHCIAGQDRTGAVAFILNALLGVEEEELWRDWETTGFWNGDPAFCHARLFNRLVKVFDKYPGETVNARVEAYVLSLGFTPRDIDLFRSIMLE